MRLSLINSRKILKPILCACLFCLAACSFQVDVRPLYNAALLARGNGDFAGALWRLKEVIRNEPGHNGAYETFRKILSSQKRTEEAFEFLWELPLRNAPVLRSIGEIFLEKEQYGRAEIYFKEAIGSDPAYYPPYEKLVDILCIKTNGMTTSEQMAPVEKLASYFISLANQWPEAGSPSFALFSLYSRMAFHQKSDLMGAAIKQAVSRSKTFNERLYYKMRLHLFEGNLTGALALAQLLKHNFRRRGSREDEIKYFTYEGEINFKLARFIKSRKLLEEAVRLSDASGDINPRLYLSLGHALKQSGYYGKAGIYYKKFQESKPGKESHLYIYSFIYTGESAVYTGNYKWAIELFLEGLKLTERVDDLWAEVVFHSRLYFTYLKMGKADTADFYADKISGTLTEHSVSGIARLVCYLKAHQSFRKKDYLEAEFFLAKTDLLTYEKTAETIETAILRARIKWILGKEKEAFVYLKEALETGKKYKRHYTSILAKSIMAVWYEEKGLTEISLEYYVDVIYRIDLFLKGTSLGSVLNNISFDLRDIYNRAFVLQYERYRRNPSYDNASLLFLIMEKSRAKSLFSLLIPEKDSAAAHIDPALLEKEESLNNAFSAVHSDLILESANLPPDAIKMGRLKKELNRITEELNKIQGELALHEDKVKDFSGNISIQETVYGLEDNEVLLEYMVTEKAIYCLKIEPSDCKVFQLPLTEKELEAKISTIRSQVTQNRSSSLTENRELYEKLLGPLLKDIKEKTRLLIIPDSYLHYLPFEILVNNQGRSLIETHPVYYSQSANIRNILKKKRLPPGPKRLLALGDPDFYLNPPGREVYSKIRYVFEYPGQVPRLFNTRREVNNIASFFKEKKVLLNREALEETFKNELKNSTYSHIHLATHSILNEYNPEFSGILFAFDKDPGEDGFLQIREILKLKNRAELIVLSACKTGLGKLIPGEGIIGFTRAWLLSGASSLVVSLWDVSDYSTSILMSFFYDYLFKDFDKAAALRLAKVKLMEFEAGKFSHPYYWAGFILVGDN